MKIPNNRLTANKRSIYSAKAMIVHHDLWNHWNIYCSFKDENDTSWQKYVHRDNSYYDYYYSSKWRHRTRSAQRLSVGMTFSPMYGSALIKIMYPNNYTSQNEFPLLAQELDGIIDG